jgi:hypothetical protein
LKWKLKLQTRKSHDLKRMLNDTMLLRLFIIYSTHCNCYYHYSEEDAMRVNYCFIAVHSFRCYKATITMTKCCCNVIKRLPTLRARLDTSEFKEVELKHHTWAIWLTHGKLQFNNLQCYNGIWNLRLNESGDLWLIVIMTRLLYVLGGFLFFVFFKLLITVHFIIEHTSVASIA